jgi:hypothetical protein
MANMRFFFINWSTKETESPKKHNYQINIVETEIAKITITKSEFII